MQELLRQLVMTAPQAQARLDVNAGGPASHETANAVEALLGAELHERSWRLETFEISVAFEIRSWKQASFRAGLPPSPVAGTRLLGPSCELLYGRSENSRQQLSVTVSQPPLADQHSTREKQT